jgi:hypothetical protein
MRHLKIYEDFDQMTDPPQGNSNKLHLVAAYKSYEQWMEFMHSVLEISYFSRINHTDYERMWRDRTAYQSPTYVVDNEWIFWLESPKYPKRYNMENPAEIAALQINERRTITDSNQSRLEAALGCSYKDLIAQAKTPVENMKDEIMTNPDLIDKYSESRPKVFKGVVIQPNLPAPIKAALKWKEMKNYI